MFGNTKQFERSAEDWLQVMSLTWTGIGALCDLRLSQFPEAKDEERQRAHIIVRKKEIGEGHSTFNKCD